MITNRQLYEAIFQRKSVRKYDMQPLPGEAISELKEFTKQLKPLDETIKIEYLYLNTDDVKNPLPMKAPHYICFYSEKKDNYLMNTGFIMQQINLYLSANNLGGCWLGMAKPTKQVPEMKNGMEFVIMIAFGNAVEPVHRTNVSEFNRKSMDSICSITNSEQLFEPVRLAPSAVNTQPWFFSGTEDEIIVSREKLNLIKVKVYNKMNQIDIGIALAHLWLSCEHYGKSMDFSFEKEVTPKGYEFMITAKI